MWLLRECKSEDLPKDYTEAFNRWTRGINKAIKILLPNGSDDGVFRCFVCVFFSHTLLTKGSEDSIILTLVCFSFIKFKFALFIFLYFICR